MKLIDTHCHIHSDFFELDAQAVLAEAKEGGIEKIVCVATTVDDAKKAVAFAKANDNVFAAIAIHPHHAEEELGRIGELEELLQQNSGEIVAIGETGLDYFYGHSPSEAQKKVLEQHLELAVTYDLPCNFHVRSSKEAPNEAFADFFAIFDKYIIRPSIMHSFSAGQPQLDAVLSRPLSVGVNGIATFTKDPKQIAMYANIPLERLVLETDAPLLTPTPKRGKINVPAYMRYTLQHMADVHKVSAEVVADITSRNAEKLLAL